MFFLLSSPLSLPALSGYFFLCIAIIKILKSRWTFKFQPRRLVEQKRGKKTPIRRGCCCFFRSILSIGTEKCEKPLHSININLYATQIVNAVVALSMLCCVSSSSLTFYRLLDWERFIGRSSCKCSRFQCRCDAISLRLLLL